MSILDVSILDKGEFAVVHDTNTMFAVSAYSKGNILPWKPNHLQYTGNIFFNITSPFCLLKTKSKS